ncbi:MAG TPA: vanadium-dependent haloperoxidase [Steroidobacteraceae bacterium]|nr:vanadium-dependent haloperoxidase [Steroidobacteraceae bacterium]
MKSILRTLLSGAVLILSSSIAAANGAPPPDEVTNWNQMLFRVALVGATSPLVITRNAAIVQTSVFDAVNGIDRRYTSIHVAPAAPAGASRDAAAVQAAYATLVQLYPAQKGMLDARLTVSLTALKTREGSTAIANGLAWGQSVADAILAWRSTDGFTPAPPAFVGGMGVGQWRPTPPAFAPGIGPQFAYMTPWVMSEPGQFRPAGPPALTSDQYTTDFNETKTMGNITSTTRTPDQTISSWFWASSTASYLWNHVALSLMDRSHGDADHDRHDQHRSPTLENARLLALLNLAMADAAIGCWEAKYTYVFWRPITAIPLADTDDNPATVADPTWNTLFPTPAHPEYPSGHSCVSGAAAGVLADFFGEHAHIRVTSDVMPGVVRSFDSFTDALDEVQNARIFAGIHFRSATRDGGALGASVAGFVLDNAAQPLRRQH